MTLRVVLYSRVSSEEQEHGHSLDAQEREMRAYAAARGWQVVAALREVQSAWTDRVDKRPAFQRLLAMVRAGQVDVGLVHTFDRWSRNLLVTLETFRVLAEHRVTFASVTENVDYTTPEGRLFVHMLGAFAQYYSDAISKHVSKSKRERARKGRHNNAPPYGYCAGRCADCQHPHHNVRQTLPGGPVCPYIGQPNRGDGQTPIPHPIESAGVLLAWETWTRGDCSHADVARVLNEAGYRTRHTYTDRNPAYLWTKDAVRALLQNRFYLGEVQYRGEWYPGGHPALVTPAQWAAAQAVRAARAARPPTVRGDATRVYPLAGIVRCADCGLRLRGQANEQGRRYYRDVSRQQGLSCAQGMIPAEDIEEQVGAWLRRVTLPGAWRARVLAILAERERARPRSTGESQEALTARLRRLRDAYVLGDYDRAEYLAERERLRERLAQAAARANGNGAALTAAAALLDDFGSLWDRANLAERKRILGTVFEAVYVRGRDLVAVQPRGPFRDLLGAGDNHVPLVNGPHEVVDRPAGWGYNRHA